MPATHPSSRRPLRVIAHVMVCILIGVITTIAVAWTCAIRSKLTLQETIRNSAWPRPAPPGWPERTDATVTYSGIGLGHTHAHVRHSVEPYRWHEMAVLAAGWPLPALQASRTAAASLSGESWAEAYRQSMPLPEPSLSVPLHHTNRHPGSAELWLHRRLPLRPLPLGFAVNTVAAAAVAAVFLAVARLQPTRRGVRWWISLAVIGAVVNLAVSLGLWAHWQWRDTPRLSAPGDEILMRSQVVYDRIAQIDWPVTAPSDWPSAPEWLAWNGAAFGLTVYECGHEATPPAAWRSGYPRGPTYPTHAMLLVQTGWPFRTLQSEEAVRADVDYETLRAAIKSGGPVDRPAIIAAATPVVTRWGILSNIQLPRAPAPTDQSDPAPIIPVRPLPLGLALNTFVYTLALALLIQAPVALRTLHRRHRGRCIHCGYAAADFAVCPECGHQPLHRRERQTTPVMQR